MSLRSFRELDVWQTAMQLLVASYRVTVNFPTEEKFGLCAQIRRSAVSIPSNIAEGHARDSTKDYMRFVSIALGSLAELETQLLAAQQLSFVDSDGLEETLTLIDRTGRMLHRLQQALRRRLDPESRVPSPAKQPCPNAPI